MSYEDLFTRYGRACDDCDERIFIYLTRPGALKTTDEVERMDARTSNYIREFEHYITLLREYRQSLAARYAELETMLYTDTLKLERMPCMDGKKYYNISLTRTFEDGTTQQILYESRPGKERREAFKRFEELKRQFPGIKAEQDISRRQWER